MSIKVECKVSNNKAPKVSQIYLNFKVLRLMCMLLLAFEQKK